MAEIEDADTITTTTTPTAFPPPGWVTRREAARMLGVSLPTLGDGKWVRRLRCGVKVARPPRGWCKIYPAAEIERVRQELAAEKATPASIPEGFVDRVGARQILGITARAMTHWITDGKLRCGVTISSRVGGRCRVYPVEALKKLREEMLGRDHLFKGAAGTFEVPAGWARRREACQMFGVDRPTWDVWVRDGLLPASNRFDGGPVVYRIEDLKQMMQRAGVLAPPRPDPDTSGAYRVPLCGGSVREAGHREAIIDSETLPLLEGAVLSWESVYGGRSNFVGLCRSERPRGCALRRVIMGVTDDGLQVGHLNGDPLDCRRANLVVRTIQQRTRGARKMRSLKGVPCSSRFKGVFWETWTKKWRAKIVANGKSRSLGRYGDEIAAAQAYDEAARRLFGKYAWLNFPDGVDAWLEAQATRTERAEAA